MGRSKEILAITANDAGTKYYVTAIPCYLTSPFPAPKRKEHRAHLQWLFDVVRSRSMAIVFHSPSLRAIDVMVNYVCKKPTWANPFTISPAYRLPHILNECSMQFTYNKDTFEHDLYESALCILSMQNAETQTCMPIREFYDYKEKRLYCIDHDIYYPSGCYTFLPNYKHEMYCEEYFCPTEERPGYVGLIDVSKRIPNLPKC